MILIHSIPLARHQLAAYRRYLLGRKRTWGTARGLLHYSVMLGQYWVAKRLLTAEQRIERPACEGCGEPATSRCPFCKARACNDCVAWLRSAHAIASREGADTNWSAFRKNLELTLVHQSITLNGTSNLAAASCTAKTFRLPEGE